MNYKTSRRAVVISLIFCLGIAFKGFSISVPADSIGIEKLGNKIFILHKIEPKETLFSLSRRYNVKVEMIEIENPEVKEGIKVGQVIRIPYEPQKEVASTSANISATGTPSSASKTHVVGAGQTLYSIARQYKVTVDDLKKWNNLNSNELSTGQVIIVSQEAITPPPVTNTTEAPSVRKNMPNFKYDSKGNKVHITEQGQTLYTISQIYNLPVSQVQKLNNLTNNEISPGQEIVVELAKSSEPEVKEKNVDTIPAGKTTSNTVPNTVPVKPAALPKSEPQSSEPLRPAQNVSGLNKITERGLAEAIDDSGESPKFLALHKSASMGTIIQVKNELNNLYIFARVIGRIPQNVSNDKVVIKLSKKAYDKLGAVDKRFPVEISYVPNN